MAFQNFQRALISYCFLKNCPNKQYFYFQLCIIAECGELKEGDDWGITPQDGSGDAHPDFPEDSDIDLKDVSIFLFGYFMDCKICR